MKLESILGFTFDPGKNALAGKVPIIGPKPRDGPPHPAIVNCGVSGSTGIEPMPVVGSIWL